MKILNLGLFATIVSISIASSAYAYVIAGGPVTDPKGPKSGSHGVHGKGGIPNEPVSHGPVIYNPRFPVAPHK